MAFCQNSDFFRQSVHWTWVIPNSKVAYRRRNYGFNYALKMHDFTRRAHSSVTVSPFSCLRRHAHWHGETDPWRGDEGDGKGDRQSLLTWSTEPDGWRSIIIMWEARSSDLHVVSLSEFASNTVFRNEKRIHPNSDLISARRSLGVVSVWLPMILHYFREGRGRRGRVCKSLERASHITMIDRHPSSSIDQVIMFQGSFFTIYM